MTERDPLAAIHAELAKLVARPLAKTEVDSRTRLRCRAHAAFAAGIDHLLINGWSMARIARRLDVHPVTLKDWYERGDQQRTQLPAWAVAGLPTEARAAVLRVELEWSEPPPSGRTGTDG